MFFFYLEFFCGFFLFIEWNLVFLFGLLGFVRFVFCIFFKIEFKEFLFWVYGDNWYLIILMFYMVRKLDKNI